MDTDDLDTTAMEEDDRPPICPACGVTMGLVVDGESVRPVCLECGFEEAP